MKNIAIWCLLALTAQVAVSAWAEDAPAYDTTPLKQMPWEPTMPRDYTTEKLTPADWVGPDGIIYPNWTWAGVHIGEPGQRVRGIPELTDIHTTLDAALAGEANAEAFTEALADAVTACGESGGGVIQIPAGTYTLTRPLLIRQNNIVIRGAGRGDAVEPGGRNDPQETRIRFSFAFGGEDKAVRVLSFPFHGEITRDSEITFYAQPYSDLASEESKNTSGRNSHIYGFYVTVTPEGGEPFSLALSTNYNEKNEFDKFVHFSVGGPTSSSSISGDKLADRLKDVQSASFATKIVWKWKEKNGKETVEKEDSAVGETVTLSTGDFNRRLADGQKNMVGGSNTNIISFAGDEVTYKSKQTWLLEDAHRGDTMLRINMDSEEKAQSFGLRPGAMVKLWIYNSKSFIEAMERDGESGSQRDQYATVKAVSPSPDGGMTVEIEQPLQFDFPANEGDVDTWDNNQGKYVQTGTNSSWIKAFIPITECGMEDLVIEQTENVWFNGIRFQNAMNCWVRNVRVEKAGRDPLGMGGMMNEVRDSEFIDPIYANNTGGGSGYIHGGDYTLIDGIYTRNCRHAPNFTGKTAGVFRNSRFDSSDMQWHQNWGRAHLLENCTVDGIPGTGSYGYGAFAQRNIEAIHGAGMGPRNVIYRCDLIGSKGGVFLGGKSEGPMLLHNRIRAWSGPGLILRYHVFNGLFLNNVFAVQNRFEPAVLFGDPEPSKSRLSSTKEKPKPLTHPGIGTANPGNDFIGNTLYGGNGELAQGSYHFDFVRSDWRVSYGNSVQPWTANPPRPEPAMESVFATQIANPEGFAHLSRDEVLYQPDAGKNQPALAGDDLKIIAQVNFSDKRAQYADDPKHWHGETPGKDWFSDSGEPFGEHTQDGKTLQFGWVNGKPEVHQQAIWSDEDFRYRTVHSWGSWNGGDVRPFGEWNNGQSELHWKIELPPGEYLVFLAAGSPRKPERSESAGFVQVNDFLLNDEQLEDPGQTDVRRDSFWTTVRVARDGQLVIKPAPSAITPRINFIQIYQAAMPSASR